MNKNLLDQDKYLTLREVAEHLQVDIQVVRKWAREEIIPANKIGDKIWRIHTSDLRKMIHGVEQD